MRHLCETLITGEEGATMVEYALMIALIGGALVTVIGTLSSAISAQFTSMAADLNGAAS